MFASAGSPVVKPVHLGETQRSVDTINAQVWIHSIGSSPRACQSSLSLSRIVASSVEIRNQPRAPTRPKASSGPSCGFQVHSPPGPQSPCPGFIVAAAKTLPPCVLLLLLLGRGPVAWLGDGRSALTGRQIRYPTSSSMVAVKSIPARQRSQQRTLAVAAAATVGRPHCDDSAGDSSIAKHSAVEAEVKRPREGGRDRSPDETTDSPPSPNPPSNERINLFPPIHRPTGIPQHPPFSVDLFKPNNGAKGRGGPGLEWSKAGMEAKSNDTGLGGLLSARSSLVAAAPDFPPSLDDGRNGSIWLWFSSSDADSHPNWFLFAACGRATVHPSLAALTAGISALPPVLLTTKLDRPDARRQASRDHRFNEASPTPTILPAATGVDFPKQPLPRLPSSKSLLWLSTENLRRAQRLKSTITKALQLAQPPSFSRMISSLKDP
ncbi:hypothetical protein CKAH01_15634 [Colletotrichum kahawae]|uniref:Uncharacterized protein n=1 Tax=Colletotrichum kahawae TaxID=34407 RepID=A0AAD9YHV9_COLKA|nr:hypothetical protein CKAH01_15634 [Colletotrichum kahawae]